MNQINEITPAAAAVKKVIKRFVRIKKPTEITITEEPLSAAAAPPPPQDISIVLKHNKNYRIVLKQLLRKTAWLQWLQKFDIVMRDFDSRVPAYIAHKEQKSTVIDLPPLIIPKTNIVIIKKKKKTLQQ